MNPIVLLVDDQMENMVVLQRMFRGLSGIETINTVCFTAASDALLWCRENEPDICVVDYQMPGMNGIEFLVEVRKLPRYKGIPMIMVTGSSDSEIRQQRAAKRSKRFSDAPGEPGRIQGTSVQSANAAHESCQSASASRT